MASDGLTLNFSILVGTIAFLARKFVGSYQLSSLEFFCCAFLSVLGFVSVFKVIPRISQQMLKKDVWGYDINKNGRESNIKVPESMGVACGIIFLICAIFLNPFFQHLSPQINTALLSVSLMLLLGFLDDILEIRWAIKILLSGVATLPQLIEYSGPTTILVPKPLRDYLGLMVDLGYFYHIYMALVVVFCTNSINIYAGINGLETSQTIVIALSVLLHNYIELDGVCSDQHVLSIYLMLPFLATTLALAYYNAYPSSVFVGDSFTYFSGMTLAVASIQAHFSKTLMLFFIPQLINFTLSIPQLLGIVACPKHRLPIYDKETKLLSYSKNFTLINLFLYLTGPISEKNLCVLLTIFHVFCCACAFLVRYNYEITNIFYDPVQTLSC